MANAEYIKFTDYVLKQEFKYNTASGEYMSRLKEIALEEGYYEASKVAYDKLYEYYKPSKERDLSIFKDEIIELLEDVEMADTMRSNGKIYVVVAVLSIVLAGILIYIINNLTINSLITSEY